VVSMRERREGAAGDWVGTRYPRASACISVHQRQNFLCREPRLPAEVFCAVRAKGSPKWFCRRYTQMHADISVLLAASRLSCGPVEYLCGHDNSGSYATILTASSADIPMSNRISQRTIGCELHADNLTLGRVDGFDKHNAASKTGKSGERCHGLVAA